jgi:hypothetical protein
MLGFLVSGVFYDQLYTSVFYSIAGLNFVLSRVIERQDSSDGAPGAVDAVRGRSNARGASH